MDFTIPLCFNTFEDERRERILAKEDERSKQVLAMELAMIGPQPQYAIEATVLRNTQSQDNGDLKPAQQAAEVADQGQQPAEDFDGGILN